MTYKAVRWIAIALNLLVSVAYMVKIADDIRSPTGEEGFVYFVMGMAAFFALIALIWSVARD